MKIAIVHDYLGQFGGAERVVAVMHDMFPKAPIFTSFYLPDRTFRNFRNATIVTSFIQKLPDLARRFRSYLPLYPLAFARFDLTDYDVVLSSSSGWAHGARKRADALHICYCHTPARWLWDFSSYARRESFGTGLRTGLQHVTSLLRRWDVHTSAYPDVYVANSHAVAERIRRCYHREARVIYPPVDVDGFPVADSPGDYYLVVSRLLGYKRIGIVIDAFNQLGLSLRIIGDGPLRPTLQARANRNIVFLGAVDDNRLRAEVARCRALLLPGSEDFGIVPLEANACGRPAIAFAGGGALETVVDGVTGVLFRDPTADSLIEAIQRSARINFSSKQIREHARKFRKEVFAAQMIQTIHDSRRDVAYRAMPENTLTVSRPELDIGIDTHLSC